MKTVEDAPLVYPGEEELIACQNGIPCAYGICDECPNVLRNVKEEDE